MLVHLVNLHLLDGGQEIDEDHAEAVPLQRAALHHSPRTPASRKARLNCRYMSTGARSVPLSMPSPRATRSSMASGMMSKHLT